MCVCVGGALFTGEPEEAATPPWSMLSAISAAWSGAPLTPLAFRNKKKMIS